MPLLLLLPASEAILVYWWFALGTVRLILLELDWVDLWNRNSVDDNSGDGVGGDDM